jgi:hypothetical protein
MTRLSFLSRLALCLLGGLTIGAIGALALAWVAS